MRKRGASSIGSCRWRRPTTDDGRRSGSARPAVGGRPRQVTQWPEDHHHAGYQQHTGAEAPAEDDTGDTGVGGGRADGVGQGGGEAGGGQVRTPARVSNVLTRAQPDR